MELRNGTLASGLAPTETVKRAGAITSAGPAAGPRAEGDQLDLTAPKLDRDVIARLVNDGKTIHVRNSQGEDAQVAVSSDGGGTYHLTLDGQHIDVRIDASLPANEALSRIADNLSQLPPAMRQGVSRFEVRTKSGGDAAATTYNGHRVVFWSGMDYLRPSTFFHEMGHVNAKRVFGHTDPSDAWDRASGKDGKPITDYAATKPNEDFAEMVEAYWLAKQGDGDHTLAELRTKFPARMKIVEAIVADEPVDTKDSDYWRVFGRQIPKAATFWRKIDWPEWVESATGWLSGATSRLARLNPFA